MRVYGFVGQGRGKDLRVPLRALNGQLSQRDVEALVFRGADDIAETDALVARCILRNSLRIFVDAWIDSAKTAEDERPWERKVEPKSYLKEFVQRNPPMLQFIEEDPFLVFIPHVLDGPKQLPAFPKEEEFYRGLRNASLREAASRIFPAAHGTAVALFLQVLDSRARTQLFRCEGCQTYFMHARAPKKDMPIYHGSWCADCKNKGGAKRTKDSRAQRESEMVGWAADASLNWKPNRRQGQSTEWIVGQVNKRMPPDRDHITKNWVNRHKREIDAEVERRKNGTQKTR